MNPEGLDHEPLFVALAWFNGMTATLMVGRLSRRFVAHRDADLRYAILRDADLRGASLSGANLFRAKLIGAKLIGANCWGTVFADVDLAKVKGLESIKHIGPSTAAIAPPLDSLDDPHRALPHQKGGSRSHQSGRGTWSCNGDFQVDFQGRESVP